jgi:hypothetical protein
MLQFSDYKINTGLFEENLDLLVYAHTLAMNQRIYYQQFRLAGSWMGRQTFGFCFVPFELI